MRLITWNVNGLRSVQRNAGLDAVLALGPDVLLLQETKLGSNTPRAAFDGYHASFSTATASAHWGAATITRIPPTSVVTSVVPNRRFNDEGRTVHSIFHKLAILNVYIPQGNRDGRNLDYKLDCLTALIDLVRQWAGPPLLLAEISTLREGRET
jgi:exodeoxyribonuclease-3